jgi:hypothetical protein
MDNWHSIAPMEDKMEILHVTKKGNKMNPSRSSTYTM